MSPLDEVIHIIDTDSVKMEALRPPLQKKTYQGKDYFIIHTKTVDMGKLQKVVLFIKAISKMVLTLGFGTYFLGIGKEDWNKARQGKILIHYLVPSEKIKDSLNNEKLHKELVFQEREAELNKIGELLKQKEKEFETLKKEVTDLNEREKLLKQKEKEFETLKERVTDLNEREKLLKQKEKELNNKKELNISTKSIVEKTTSQNLNVEKPIIIKCKKSRRVVLEKEFEQAKEKIEKIAKLFFSSVSIVDQDGEEGQIGFFIDSMSYGRAFEEATPTILKTIANKAQGNVFHVFLEEDRDKSKVIPEPAYPSGWGVPYHKESMTLKLNMWEEEPPETCDIRKILETLKQKIKS